jgi:hypothetical protein
MTIETTVRRLLLALLCLLMALPAIADTRFRIRQMTRNDVPIGKGQCDIRLQVDGEVEVSVRGDMVYIRTISGRDARDDGSECNAPLPPTDPRNFGFEVKDRRGDIRLLAEPSRRSDFSAIVRIRDDQGGEGRYHFRLTWAITGGGDRFDDRRGSGDRFDDRRGGHRDWDRTVDFSGRGDGRYSREGSGWRRVTGVSVRIDRDGHVFAGFDTQGWGRIELSGRIIRVMDGGRIAADMRSEDPRGPHGEMVIVLDRDRVREVNLSGTAGRDPCELSWRGY